MYDYQTILKRKTGIPDETEIRKDIESADSWEDAYWIGRCVYAQGAGESDKLVMDACEKAFESGLNIRVNKECFLTATQQIARIYLQFRMYDEAVNKLMVLDSNMESLPDWVNLYYASAQIHTDNILYWAEVPRFFFRRIEGINESDPESVKRRTILFLEFLNRISDLSRTKEVSKVDTRAILEKAEELGVFDYKECRAFKAALGMSSDSYEASYLMETKDETEEEETAAFVQEAAAMKKSLAEQQYLLADRRQAFEHEKEIAEAKQKQIMALQTEAEHFRNVAEQREEELKKARKQAADIQAQYEALERQITGDEAVGKQKDSRVSGARRLRDAVENLKRSLIDSRRDNQKLFEELVQAQETIKRLNDELFRSREEAQELFATIEKQKTQIEVAEAAVKASEKAVKAAEERAAAAELAKEAGTEPEITDISSKFSTLRSILAVDNFLPRKQKILIIGGSETKENLLRGKLKSMGFEFAKDQLEFELEYNDVKDYAARIQPWSGKYAGIIVGPCPHKVKETDGYSSFIEQLKSEEGYPHVEEARDKSGTLKISKGSIGDAMMKMAVYLQSIA